jgi:hypothetical protein
MRPLSGFMTPSGMRLGLTASGAMDWPGFEIVCGKLEQTGLRTWTQRPAVEEFLRTFWTAALHRFAASPPISEVLGGIATVARDISAYLAEWAATRTLPLAVPPALSRPPALPGDVVYGLAHVDGMHGFADVCNYWPMWLMQNPDHC